MQIKNLNDWEEKPNYEKRYSRSKIIRFGEYKKRTNLICDFEGNFNLMCSNPRAIRLLQYIKTARPPVHLSNGQALADEKAKEGENYES